jgi:hypothetical protein
MSATEGATCASAKGQKAEKVVKQGEVAVVETNLTSAQKTPTTTKGRNTKNTSERRVKF